MIDAFKRLLGMTGKRSLDAAGTGRRWAGAKTINNLNSDILATAGTIQRRAAYFARNNAHITAAVNALVSNIVGPGIKPSCQHPDPAIRELVHALWAEWVDRADFDGAGDFYALQALMVRQMVEAGESFGRMLVTPDAGAVVPLQVQVIHPSQVPIETVSALVNGRVWGGIEMDGEGRRIAFHVLTARPDDPRFPALGNLWNPIRVPVSEILHLMNPVEPGQLRGLSWLAPVLLAVSELDQLQDAALVRAKLANLLCAALVDPNGDAAGLDDGTSSAGELTVGLEPGAVLPLKPGTSLEFFDPKESEHYGAFVKTHLRAIASGLGIPYELLTGDLESVNYSSIRGGMVEFRKRLEHWQHNVVVYRLCRPVWDRFIRMAVLSGQIPAAAYNADPFAFHRVSWLPPKQQWVDPKSDAEAEILMVNACFKSRSQVVTSLGYDPEQVDAEIAADAKRAERLKLPIAAPPAALPAPVTAPENPVNG